MILVYGLTLREMKTAIPSNICHIMQKYTYLRSFLLLDTIKIPINIINSQPQSKGMSKHCQYERGDTGLGIEKGDDA
jgi:hypothetical protein